MDIKFHQQANEIALREPGVTVEFAFKFRFDIRIELMQFSNEYTNCRFEKNRFTFRYNNGSRVIFRAFENPNDARGILRDYLFFYESLDIAIIELLRQRTRLGEYAFSDR